MPTQRTRMAAARGRHRFSISTKLMQDYGIETPVSGATQIVTARGEGGRHGVLSIGSDRHLHCFSRSASGRWTRQRLPWTASSIAVVPQRDGTDKVFIADLTGDDEKTATVYELENAGREPQRRLHGRFITTDPKVYGLGPLSGAQCRDGSNILVTTLATHPADDSSGWLVLFGHGSSTGALSRHDGRGVVADRVKVAGEDPGSTRWPHMSFVLLDRGKLRLEWGARGGVLLQSERIALPELDGVIDFDVVRDHRGHLKIFALDRCHHLHVLCQVGGGGERRPRFPSSWTRLDCTQSDGSRPTLRRLFPLRRADGDLEVFALGGDDRLWSITENSGSRNLAGTVDGWGRLHDLGVHAAHLAVAVRRGKRAEVFAVSRQNQLLWLRRDHQENWRLERVGWKAEPSEKTKVQIYRTGLTVLDESHGAVPGVAVSITANERVSSTVNGLSYAIGPREAVVAETNAFGKISVTFETTGARAVPSLSFEAGFLDGGLIDVNPERKAHIYVAAKNAAAPSPSDTRSRLFLIPEDTVIEQS